jgi:adenosylmethionine-8-amino-7-oxononanoate aminotransferase
MTAILPDLLTDAQTTEERFLRQTAFGVRVRSTSVGSCLLCRFDPNWLAFGPPLVVTTEQLEEMRAVPDRSSGETLAELDGAA